MGDRGYYYQDNFLEVFLRHVLGIGIFRGCNLMQRNQLRLTSFQNLNGTSSCLSERFAAHLLFVETRTPSPMLSTPPCPFPCPLPCPGQCQCQCVNQILLPSSTYLSSQLYHPLSIPPGAFSNITLHLPVTREHQLL